MTGGEPMCWLNFKGDRRHATNPRGPTWDGMILIPLDAAYDPEKDMTRMGFIKVPMGAVRDFSK